jgi:hypothetical protein
MSTLGVKVDDIKSLGGNEPPQRSGCVQIQIITD